MDRVDDRPIVEILQHGTEAELRAVCRKYRA